MGSVENASDLVVHHRFTITDLLNERALPGSDNQDSGLCDT